MTRVLGRRLALTVGVIVGVSLITFFLARVVPGNPARLIAGPRATGAVVAHIRAQYGLDLPLWQQYWKYVGGLVHLRFGESFVTRRGVGTDLATFFPATIELTVFAMFFGTCAAVLAAVLGLQRFLEPLVRVSAVAALSVPSFLAALLLRLFVGDKLGWLPVSGRLSTGASPPPKLTGLYTIDSIASGRWATLGDALQHLILPGLALSLGVFGLMTRIVRAGLLDVVNEDFVRTARAKGLSPRRILVRHILRNALLPAVTVLGLEFGVLAGGVFVVEYVFAWPGIGLYAFNAFAANDYNAIMGVTLVVAVVYVLSNLAVDLVYLYLDPRVRYR